PLPMNQEQLLVSQNFTNLFETLVLLLLHKLTPHSLIMAHLNLLEILSKLEALANSLFVLFLSSLVHYVPSQLHGKLYLRQSKKNHQNITKKKNPMNLLISIFKKKTNKKK